MMFSCKFAVFIVVLGLTGCQSTTKKRRLNSFISHYETLDYSLNELHSRVRRSTVVSPFAIVDMKFKALGKDFHVRLRRDHAIFTPHHKVVDGRGRTLKFDNSRFYEGDVVGQHNSYAHGIIRRGRFQGKIKVPGDEYHIEPAYKYFKGDQDFHSIIYSLKDVHYNFNFADPKMRIPKAKRATSHREKRNAEPGTSEDVSLEQMISDANKHHVQEDVKERYRRGVRNRHKNTCTLKLVADHKFTRKFLNKENAVIEMVNHFKAVEFIFRNQTFNMSQPADRFYNPEGIGFRISTVIVYDDYDVPKAMKSEYVSVDNLLEVFSSEDHTPACEAFLFTDRTFDRGVVGLAWIGYPYGQAGGICDKYANYNGKLRSYNTGLVTFKLYGRDSPPAVTEITFAHELGHAFGAQHDPKECQPGGKDGNYIMYDKATSGNQRNNRYFSKCSMDSMVPVINTKGLDPQNGCFIDVSIAICGNGVVEYPELCDCGSVTTCREQCCTPYGSSYGRPCTLRDEAYRCSPSRGSCCDNETCKVYHKGYRCSEQTECLYETMCDGRRAECPKVKPKANLTYCDKERSVCMNGFCVGSICLKHNMPACMCSKQTELCDVCCVYQKKCTPLKSIAGFPKKKMSRGSPCNNYKGYCDGLGVCQGIDMRGPLRSLYTTLFTYEGIREWLAKYWFVIVTCVLLLLAFMVAFVYFCQRVTPSSNPEREMRRPTRTLRGGTRPPPSGARNRGTRRPEDGMPMI